MPSSPLDDLEQALAAAGRVVAQVPADGWAAPSPCAGWDVADVVQHLTHGNLLFAAALTGGTAPETPPGPEENRAPAYERSARVLREAAAGERAPDATVTVPFGTVPVPVALMLRVVEGLVHGWDVAVATGQVLPADDALVERARAFSAPLLDRLPPGRSPFGPPAPVADDAPPLDRLVALLGRSPRT